MTDRELLQQALDALQGNWRTDESDKAIEALRARIAQPEPEPVVWISTSPARMIHWTSDKPVYDDDWKPLYTAPPQREWVGLTHEEKMEILTRSITAPSRIDVAEAALKEKNSG